MKDKIHLFKILVFFLMISCNKNDTIKEVKQIKVGNTELSFKLDEEGLFCDTMFIKEEKNYKIVWNKGYFKKISRMDGGEYISYKLIEDKKEGTFFFDDLTKQKVEYPFKKNDSLNLFFYDNLKIMSDFKEGDSLIEVTFRNVIPNNFMIMYKGVLDEEFSFFDQKVSCKYNSKCDSAEFKIGVFYSNQVKFKEMVFKNKNTKAFE